MGHKHIEIVARAVVMRRGKILLCYLKESGHHFFPGGHVKPGERVQDALRREFKEELGLTPKKISFVGAAENEYRHRKEGPIYEINLVFHVVVNKLNTKSREGHISFKLVDEREFSRANVLPIALKRAVQKWLRDGKTFWASSMK